MTLSQKRRSIRVLETRVDEIPQEYLNYCLELKEKFEKGEAAGSNFGFYI